MNPKPYRVTYHSRDDTLNGTWCRYFSSHTAAIRYMRQKAEYGYRACLTFVPDL